MITHENADANALNRYREAVNVLVHMDSSAAIKSYKPLNSNHWRRVKTQCAWVADGKATDKKTS